MSRGPMCAKGRPNQAEMGLGRTAWPFPEVVRPPKYVEAPPFAERAIHPRGRPQARAEEEERNHLQGGSLYSKEATIKWRRTSRPCQDTPRG
jgi:hypothetical protein